MSWLIAFSLAYWVEGEGAFVHVQTLIWAVMHSLPFALPSILPTEPPLVTALPGPLRTGVKPCHKRVRSHTAGGPEPLLP